VVRATIPAADLEFLHKSLNLWTSLTRTLRGKEKLRKEGRNGKMKEVREMGRTPSSYLMGLLYNLSFVPRYLSRTT
jgi:hypothetical protein